ncbi:MAG: DUF3108 domain-containing protein [Gemmatimonadota bacterium]|jgi:hypothetical protein
MRRGTKAGLRVVALTAATAAAGGAPLPAQNGGPPPTRPASVPFGVGERAEYTVSLGILGDVGEGAMEVVGLEDVHGHETYHLRLDIEGKVLVGSVDTRLESWLDTHQLFARRFHKDQKELSYEADRWYDFHPDSMIYRRRSTGAVDTLASSQPLDDVSFLYFARTLPLEVGDTYTFERYYKESGNPVRLEVLRREVMMNPNGDSIPVVVVQPIIQTGGLFGEGGEAEVYFTDDWRRILVKMTSKVPVIGRLGLTLTGYTPGRRLAESRGSP